jgi:hypothetical protein
VTGRVRRSYDEEYFEVLTVATMVSRNANEAMVALYGGDPGVKKCKQGRGGVYGGRWRNVYLARVWSQAVGFVLVRLAVTAKMFSHLVYFLKKCSFRHL